MLSLYCVHLLSLPFLAEHPKSSANNDGSFNFGKYRNEQYLFSQSVLKSEVAVDANSSLGQVKK